MSTAMASSTMIFTAVVSPTISSVVSPMISPIIAAIIPIPGSIVTAIIIGAGIVVITESQSSPPIRIPPPCIIIPPWVIIRIRLIIIFFPEGDLFARRKLFLFYYIKINTPIFCPCVFIVPGITGLFLSPAYR
jgi:hypothetical protein